MATIGVSDPLPLEKTFANRLPEGLQSVLRCVEHRIVRGQDPEKVPDLQNEEAAVANLKEHALSCLSDQRRGRDPLARTAKSSTSAAGNDWRRPCKYAGKP